MGVLQTPTFHRWNFYHNMGIYTLNYELGRETRAQYKCTLKRQHSALSTK